MKDIENAIASRLWVKDIGVVPSSSLPQNGWYPLSVFRSFRWSLLDCFENVGYFVDLVHGVNEQMDVVRHEDVGKDGKVKLFGCFVDSPGQCLADSIRRVGTFGDGGSRRSDSQNARTH